MAPNRPENPAPPESTPNPSAVLQREGGVRYGGRWALIMSGVWLGLVALSFLSTWRSASKSGEALALTEARSSYNKDLVYRRWATSHGGVYVPPTTNTPANPYLEVPHRDVVTTSGQALTLINPAYMTRQVHELGEQQYGVRAHITSLNPIRPANAADAWETNALRAFEAGVKEVSSLETMLGQPYLRFMRPMPVERGCLKCHAKQGYREGDIRGGISVSVPMTPFQAIVRAQMLPVGVAHLVLGGLGLAGIGWGRRRLHSFLAEREALHQRFRLFYENAPVAYHALDEEGRIVEVNDAWLALLGYARFQVLDRPFGEFLSSMDAAAFRGHLQTLKTQGFLRGIEYNLRPRQGGEVHVACDSQAERREAGPSLRTHWILHNITERKLAEVALQRSDRHLKTVLSTALDGFAITNTGGRLLEVNEGLCRLLGYSRAELLQRGIQDLESAESALETAAHITRIIKTGADRFTSRLRRRDRAEIEVDVSVSYMDADGGRFVAFIRDMTERHRAEATLRESEVRFRQIIELSAAAYFRIGRDGCFEQVNQAWLAIHGFSSPEEIVGRSYAVTQTEEDAPRAKEIVEQVLRGEAVASGEFTRRRRDGSVGYHTFSVWPIRSGGKIEGIEGFLIDTSDLHQFQANYQMLFTRMMDGFAVHEIICSEAGAPMDYRFLAVNPAFERLTGLKAKDLVGRTLSSVLPGEDASWVEIYGRVALTGEPVVFERESPELGRVYQVSAFRPASGQFACIFADITERRRLEAQLRQAQKMEAIGQLAGGVAHDFNNILAAILLNLGMLRGNPTIDADTQEVLGEVEVEAKRAANLTRQLLMFSRRSVLQIQQVDLNEVVANLLKMLGRLIGEHIDLQFHPKTGLPPVEADAGMIEQVLMNLSVNARDAMPKGGRLRIATETIEVTAGELRWNPDRRSGLFVCLTVTDTGCGMDEATLKRIFEPFFTTKETGKGTGLGLATAYGIVAQHQGWIDVQSQVNQGTTFRVCLPASSSATGLATATGCAPVPGGSETILLVEDDAGVRRTIARALQARGYTVLEAGNGQEAIALWETHEGRIGLLFTDMVMPQGMTGLDLAERLRSLRPGLKVILSSGYIGELSQEGIPAQAGFTFLPKPYDTAALCRMVRECLDRA